MVTERVLKRYKHFEDDDTKYTKYNTATHQIDHEIHKWFGPIKRNKVVVETSSWLSVSPKEPTHGSSVVFLLVFLLPLDWSILFSFFLHVHEHLVPEEGRSSDQAEATQRL